jgi:hypothetical protein
LARQFAITNRIEDSADVVKTEARNRNNVLASGSPPAEHHAGDQLEY